MRTVAIAVLAVLLASIAAADEQSSARAVQDRWPNCSQLIHGRLGALHPAEGNLETDFIMTGVQNGTYLWRYGDSQVVQKCVTSFAVTYSPCMDLVKEGFITVTVNQPLDIIKASICPDYLPRTWTFHSASMVDGGKRVVSFHMPEKVGDVAHFTGDYSSLSNDGSVATVTSNSDSNANVPILAFVDVNFNSTKAFGIEFSTVQACARFPYSNESVPPGGVAAIIIVIIAFVLEIGVCAWYRKNNSNTTPYSTADSYQNVE